MNNNRKAATMIVVAIISACPAFADAQTPSPIQMLPPTFLGSATVCTGGNQVLSYSGISVAGGQSGINCTPTTTDQLGDLSTSGYVQLGNTAAPCDAAHNGAIRFNTETNAFEGCISGTWQSFGGTPSGAIMAFNLPTCPSGWVDVPALAGRTVIGTGQGSGLTARNLGDYGGEETHQQTIAEMPAHNHSYANGNVSFDTAYQMSTGSVVPHYALATGGVNNSGTIGETGGNQPFNVMQPWYALLYCMKQ